MGSKNITRKTVTPIYNNKFIQHYQKYLTMDIISSTFILPRALFPERNLPEFMFSDSSEVGNVMKLSPTSCRRVDTNVTNEGDRPKITEIKDFLRLSRHTF
jgi:hypothetical protein